MFTDLAMMVLEDQVKHVEDACKHYVVITITASARYALHRVSYCTRAVCVHYSLTYLYTSNYRGLFTLLPLLVAMSSYRDSDNGEMIQMYLDDALKRSLYIFSPAYC